MKKKRYVISSYNTNKYIHRQGKITALHTKSDQLSVSSTSSMEPTHGYSQMSTLDDSQAFNVGGEYQYSEPYTSTTGTTHNNNSNTQMDNEMQSWDQLLGEKISPNEAYRDVPRAEGSPEQPLKFLFPPPGDSFTLKRESPKDKVYPDGDYESLIRAKNLFYDPAPKVIRKSSNTTPLVYNQNIMVRFLQPPPVPQGPLIIREVRAPQPPPPPPLVIRQHPPPPLSPPPIILREKPPSVPELLTAKVITKTLPPVAPPPRSVIIENLPRLPEKPRDVIIERWIPYEAMYKRPVVIHRAKPPKPYPTPRNVIITYEPVQTRVVRQFQRLGVTPEDPTNYSKHYGNSLLETDQLMAQIKELGIDVDLSPPVLLNGKESPYTKLGHTSPQRQLYGDSSSPKTNYSPTYDNLVHASALTRKFDESKLTQVARDNLKLFSNHLEDLTNQLAVYGISPETLTY